MSDVIAQAKRAVSDLVLQRPFYAVLALRLAIQESTQVPTLCTDGRTLWLNPAYYDSLSREHRATAIAHEVMHCVLGHPWRLGSYQSRKWQRATDFEVNGMLRAEGCPLHVTWLYDERYAGMSADRIYRMLPDEGEGDGHAEGDGDGECVCMRAPEGAAQDTEALSAAWRNAALQAGSMTGSAVLLAMGAARQDWREVLRFQLSVRAGCDDYTMRRPSRRYIQHGLYMPSMVSHVSDLDVIVDTSGSVLYADLLGQFLAEVDSIHATSCGTTRVIYADCEVQAVETYGPGESVCDATQPRGGGGTTFAPHIAFARAERDVQIAYFTDGEGDYGAEVENVTWVIPASCRRTAPWGVTVVIE